MQWRCTATASRISVNFDAGFMYMCINMQSYAFGQNVVCYVNEALARSRDNAPRHSALLLMFAMLMFNHNSVLRCVDLTNFVFAIERQRAHYVIANRSIIA